MCYIVRYSYSYMGVLYNDNNLRYLLLYRLRNTSKEENQHLPSARSNSACRSFRPVPPRPGQGQAALRAVASPALTGARRHQECSPSAVAAESASKEASPNGEAG